MDMAEGDRWFFDRVAFLYDRVMPTPASSGLQAGLSFASRTVERVFDVGGGTGRASRALRVPERVVVDTSSRMLRRVPPGLDSVQASATDLPFADQITDAVLIVDAFHHFPDHDRVLREARRTLRPGGVVVIQDFDRRTGRGRLIEAVEKIVGMEAGFLTPRSLADDLASAGFEPTILENGVTYTVAGRKPGGP